MTKAQFVTIVSIVALTPKFVVGALTPKFVVGALAPKQGYRSMKQALPTLFQDKTHPIQPCGVWY
jgi:hypothetical protein